MRNLKNQTENGCGIVSKIKTGNKSYIAKTNTISIKGCKVTLNFLPESNGKSIDTVKKILTSSQYWNMSSESD